MHQWFYVDARKQRRGPLSSADILHQLHAGALAQETMLWRAGLKTWVPLKTLKKVLQTDAMPPIPTGNAPPVVSDVEYAGFWRRCAAICIDGVIFSPVASGLILIAHLSAQRGPPFYILHGHIVSLLLFFFYFSIFHASVLQATPGKLALGLQVVDMRLRRIGFLRALGRDFCRFFLQILIFINAGVLAPAFRDVGLLAPAFLALSFAIPLAWFGMAGWTRKKQAMHDKICGTLVIRKPS